MNSETFVISDFEKVCKIAREHNVKSIETSDIKIKFYEDNKPEPPATESKAKKNQTPSDDDLLVNPMAGLDYNG